jgi:hypothetical protein
MLINDNIFVWVVSCCDTIVGTAINMIYIYIYIYIYT